MPSDSHLAARAVQRVVQLDVTLYFRWGEVTQRHITVDHLVPMLPCVGEQCQAGPEPDLFPEHCESCAAARSAVPGFRSIWSSKQATWSEPITNVSGPIWSGNTNAAFKCANRRARADALSPATMVSSTSGVMQVNGTPNRFSRFFLYRDVEARISCMFWPEFFEKSLPWRGRPMPWPLALTA